MKFKKIRLYFANVKIMLYRDKCQQNKSRERHLLELIQIGRKSYESKKNVKLKTEGICLTRRN